MNIKIRDYKKFDKEDSKVKGVASIQLNVEGFPLTINDVKVIQSNNGTFFALPQRSYKDQNGEYKNVSICGFFDKQAYAEFQEAMKHAFTQYFEKQKAAPAQPVQQSQDLFTSQNNYDNVPF